MALRWFGVKIGKGCLIYSKYFSTEPYLIEIGNHVVIANGTRLLTHDGSVWLFRNKYPGMDIFGKIIIGDNTCVGLNCIIMPNTTIGANCVIGAGSVVRGIIPEGSVVCGNPAKVIFNTKILEKILLNHHNMLNTKNISAFKRKKMIKKHFSNLKVTKDIILKESIGSCIT